MPHEIIKRIIQLDQNQTSCPSKGSGESAEWLNSIVDWLFSTMQPSPALRLGFFTDSFADSVLDLKRTSLAYLLHDASLVSVATGNSLPTLTALRVIPWEEDDSEDSSSSLLSSPLPVHPSSSRLPPPVPFVAAMHLSYEGGVGAAVRFDLAGGFLPPIWISERLVALEGVLYVCCLDKVLYYGFAPPLGRLHMDGEICIGNSRWPRLSRLLARHLFPWLFRRKWVMPAMKAKWLYDRPPIPGADAAGTGR